MSYTKCSFNFKMENNPIKVQFVVLLLKCQTIS